MEEKTVYNVDIKEDGNYEITKTKEEVVPETLSINVSEEVKGEDKMV